MMTGTDEANEEMIVRDGNNANSCGEETEVTKERLDTTLEVEDNKLQKRSVNLHCIHRQSLI
jgi:hypothetical protein